MEIDTGTFLYKLLSGALLAQDGQRDRSTQKEIGPSQIGGCRRQVYHQIIDTPVTNPFTEGLAAILGSFIHAGIAEAIKREDPFGDNFLIEQEFSADGLPAHTDLYIKDKHLVVDWKTSTKKSMKFFPSEQQITQVQIYAYVLEQNGHTPKEVALVVIPRDGKMNEILVHLEPYSPDKAKAGLAWLAEVKQMAVDKQPPPPEKAVHFCASYCDWYDPTGEVGCTSMRRG
jgi:CRISPR/Cas system-associated exonuclease Cas4 (RecB family)